MNIIECVDTIFKNKENFYVAHRPYDIVISHFIQIAGFSYERKISIDKMEYFNDTKDWKRLKSTLKSFIKECQGVAKRLEDSKDV